MSFLDKIFGTKKTKSSPSNTEGNEQFPYVMVHSHARSGTHFLEAFLAKNFYPNVDLTVKPIVWGHWSNRIEKPEGNPYGQLFGSHSFPSVKFGAQRKIYIRRNPMAVAYSLWKTPNFYHKDKSFEDFTTFLKTQIDWYGSPGKEGNPEMSVVEHWKKHVEAWEEHEKRDANTLVIHYEDLVSDPYKVYQVIWKKFFSEMPKLKEEEMDPIVTPTGLLPNKATVDSYKDVFTEEDYHYFESIL